jgi:hypothetical protein
MVSTIDTKNGFRVALLPWALGHSSSASLALRNAIMALAAFHQFGSQAALPFKMKALRFLASSMWTEDDTSPELSNAQLAASMMLCVYNVGLLALNQYFYGPFGSREQGTNLALGF